MQYSRYSKLFHWIIAIAVLVEYLSTLVMPEEARTPEALVNFHMSFGLVILALMFVRLVSRLFTAVPPPEASMPMWQERLSRITHYALYSLLIVMPVAGWLWASSMGWQVTLFGLVDIPQLVSAQAGLAEIFEGVHSFVGGLILTIVGLHVAAALYHWLILKDSVMQRMWP